MSASPYYIKLPDKKELFFSFFSKIIFVFLKTIQFNYLNLFLFLHTLMLWKVSMT